MIDFLNRYDICIEEAVAILMGQKTILFYGKRPRFRAQLEGALSEPLENLRDAESDEDEELIKQYRAEVDLGLERYNFAEALYSRLCSEVAKDRQGKPTEIVVVHDDPADYSNVLIARQSVHDWAEAVRYSSPLTDGHTQGTDAAPSAGLLQEAIVQPTKEEALFLSICWFMDYVLTKTLPDWITLANDPEYNENRLFIRDGAANPRRVFELFKRHIPNPAGKDLFAATKPLITKSVDYILNNWAGENPVTPRKRMVAYRALYGLLLAAHDRSQGDMNNPLSDPKKALPAFIQSAHKLLAPPELLTYECLAECVENCMNRSKSDNWKEPT